MIFRRRSQGQGMMEQGLLLPTIRWKYRRVLLGLRRRLLVRTHILGRGGPIRVTAQRLKYSRIISSRDANRMGMFQYPGDSKSPSNRLSLLIISRISREDFAGVIGGVDRANALYFCFASTYLYRKSRSIQATASAKSISKNRFLSAFACVPSVATSTLFSSYAYARWING